MKYKVEIEIEQEEEENQAVAEVVAKALADKYKNAVVKVRKDQWWTPIREYYEVKIKRNF